MQANLGTGLVNLTIKTLHASIFTSLAILIIYIGALALVAHLLQRWNISLKL